MRVIFAQFFKDGKSGEIKVLRDIPGITVLLPKSDYKLFENMTAVSYTHEAASLCF